MVAAAYSSHPTTVAISYESTFSQPPADAAAWATAEGTTVDRIRCIEIDPAFIRQAGVVDPNLKDTIFGKDKPIKGLRNADGGNMTLQLHGAEASTTAGSQVTETALMRVFEHALGGLKLGYSTVVGATVGSDTSFDVSANDGAEPGSFYAIADTDDSGRLFPIRLLTVSGSSVTTDMAPPFTVAASDVLHACAVAYIDPDALMNPSDAAASTISMLIQRSNQRWQFSGGKLQLDSFELPRGDVPRATFGIFSAYCDPPGDGAPAAPTWTGTIQGDQGLPVGADTKVFLQDKGTTAYALVDVISATVTPGVPVVPQDVITESQDRAQGRAGYGTQPADTIIELQVYLDTGWQDDWDTTQAKVLRIFQVAGAGDGWFLHASECYLMDAPEFGSGNEAGIYTLRFVCHEDRSLDATASTLELARSKLCVGFY